LAVIEELKKNESVEILYIGSEKTFEKKMVESSGVSFVPISCGKLRRYFSVQNFLDIFNVIKGVSQSRKILKNFKPDVVFSKGGYVSLPVCFAAYSLKIPIVVHESDISPGLANRIIFKLSKKILLSFEDTKKYLKPKLAEKCIVTSSPIRSEIFHGDEDRGYKFTGLDKHRPVILSIGGSQGADQINKLVRGSLDELLKRFQIIHVVGKGNLDIGIHKKGYIQYEFLNEQLPDVYAMSELVVTRGGANSLFELGALAKKALVIPLGQIGSRGEQELNASFFVHNLGWSMIGGDITLEDFIDNIEMAFRNQKATDYKILNGSKEIAKLIINETK